MGGIGSTWLGVYRNWRRLRDGVFSRLARGGFRSFGSKSHLSLPVTLHRPDLIAVGAGVYFGPGCWLQALPRDDDRRALVEVGDRCSFAGYDVLSAAHRIVVEPAVLFARNVYVSDHVHAFADPSRPIQDQGLAKVAEVVIEEGAWLGQNVVVCPGVRIGRGAVVGAGSVVNQDVPARTLAVGAPARVVKELQRK
jgi:acetyltransferase-like isoleucine patch superfamily enzyme